MKNFNKIKIIGDSTIKKALRIISNGNIKIAIIVDKRGKLIGTLSDGDIRRGFLRGLNLRSSILPLINKKPFIGKKNDSKKKLLNIAFSKKINQIPIIDNKKKLVDILIADNFLNQNIKLNKVLIMAGGKGTRLRPLTKDIPKPMLQVGGKPILQTIIQRFSDCGFKNIIICVNYKSQIIKNYFGNGKKFGVEIEYIKEKKRMGTVGALSLIKKKITEPFFVVNGDLLTNLDFEKILDFHEKQNAVATMGVKEYSIISPYGEVELVNENITSINEKPTHEFFFNIGIYVLNPECINLIPKNKFYDMTSLFKKMIKKKKKIISFPIKEYWTDIGRIADYKKANHNYFDIFK